MKNPKKGEAEMKAAGSEKNQVKAQNADSEQVAMREELLAAFAWFLGLPTLAILAALGVAVIISGGAR